jgi:hypothetical protein
MRLQIDGDWHELIPLTEFKTRFQLPPDFGISLFEPKDYTGLARLDQAGDALQRLQRETVVAVPEVLQWPKLFTVLDQVQQTFASTLDALNPSVGLRPVEVEFAVSGLGDLCQLFGYELMRIYALKQPLPQELPHDLYQQWLNSSVRISSTRHAYRHDDAEWQIQILNTIYGRVGFIIHLAAKERFYVQDSLYTCPADAFMLRLFMQLSRKIVEGLRQDSAGKSS